MEIKYNDIESTTENRSNTAEFFIDGAFIGEVFYMPRIRLFVARGRAEGITGIGKGLTRKEAVQDLIENNRPSSAEKKKIAEKIQRMINFLSKVNGNCLSTVIEWDQFRSGNYKIHADLRAMVGSEIEMLIAEQENTK